MEQGGHEKTDHIYDKLTKLLVLFKSNVDSYNKDIKKHPIRPAEKEQSL